MKYFVANWKANKNKAEVSEWLNTFLPQLRQDTRLTQLREKKETCIVICPPAPFLDTVHEAIRQEPGVYVGAQDVSHFPTGSYTGELAAKSVSGLAEFAIIGHSERRRYFQETDGVLAEKLEHARSAGLKSILCLDSTRQLQPGADIIAYEPLEAIGTGHNESLSDVIAFCDQLHLQESQAFLYGGSVNASNCVEYLSHPQIHGLLIGTASLDPHEFYSIIAAH